MNKLGYRKITLIVSLSVIVSLVTIGGLWMAYAQFEGPEVLAQGNFDGWGYVAYREDGGVVAEVMYDRDTPEGIKAYAAANSIWARDLLQNNDTVHVVVVLRKPISFEQFQAKVENIGIDVESFVIRAFAPDGERWTIFGEPSEEELVPQRFVDQAIENVLGKTKVKLEIAGIVTFSGRIDRDAYLDLSADSEVFFIDIMAEIVRQEVRRTLDDVSVEVEVHSVPTYWFMENLGLKAFEN